MSALLWLAPLCGYALFVAVRLGLHQRLPLVLGPISLDSIPSRAAQKYGERPLFTTDRPCAWDVPAPRPRYPDAQVWSAARIEVTTGCLAEMLQARLKVRIGDRVAILKENHLDIHIVAASVVRVGAIACPINNRFAAKDLEPYLANLGASVLFSDSATLLRVLREGWRLGCAEQIVLAERRSDVGDAALDELCRLLRAFHPAVRLLWIEEALTGCSHEAPAVPRGSDDVLYLVHSSGTTGFPKAVILKNGPQSHAVRGWLCYVHVSREGDRGYMAVPNNHQAVILTFYATLLLGARVHWTSAYARDDFDAERVIHELAEGRFTGFFGFPITYTQLKEIPLERYDLRRMRFWGSTADASHEVVERRMVRMGGTFRKLGIPITGSVYLDAQGSSEVGTPSVIRYITPLTRTFGRRIGRPGSTPFGPQIRITRSDGEPARRGEAGRLEVRGKTVFAGYWNDAALTCRAFRGGWFFTGDVARREQDGHLVQLDREVDVIHTRSGAVYSLPIEEEIHKHPAVFDTCVYGERQPDGTQLPAAAVALRAGAQTGAEQLRRELNARLAATDHLHRVKILPWSAFPLGVTGKTLKRVFREATEPTPAPERLAFETVLPTNAPRP